VNVDGLEQDTNTDGSEEDELEEDEFDDVVDRFESSYNFRFEEP
jgi:protein KRI1